MRASAATLPLSGYRGAGLNLGGFVLVVLHARPFERDEETAVRALEAGVAVGSSGHELGLERLPAVGADQFVRAFRGWGIRHGEKDSHEGG